MIGMAASCGDSSWRSRNVRPSMMGIIRSRRIRQGGAPPPRPASERLMTIGRADGLVAVLVEELDELSRIISSSSTTRIRCPAGN